MKLEAMRETYHAATRRVTEITQTSCLGGLGAIWILRPENAGDLIPEELLWPLAAFVLALALNLAQFIWRSAAFAVLAASRAYKREAHKAEDEGAVEAGKVPHGINAVTWAFFVSKVAAMALGFGLLANVVLQRVDTTNHQPATQETLMTD